MGWGNALFDVVTGSGLGASKEILDEVVKWGQEISDADDSGSSAQTTPSVFGGIQTTTKECCPKFEIVGDFILNTNTGHVWKYDKTSNTFIGVTKKPSKGRMAVIEEEANKFKARLNGLINEKVKTLPQAQRQAQIKKYKTQLINPIDNYLKLMK